VVQRKRRPKAALQFKPDDLGSGRQQCWLSLATISSYAGSVFDSNIENNTTVSQDVHAFGCVAGFEPATRARYTD
jgi:hypothetical protein